MQFLLNYGKFEKKKRYKVVQKKRKSYLLSEPNYHTTKSFTENILATEMKSKKQKKTEIPMNKIVY